MQNKQQPESGADKREGTEAAAEAEAPFTSDVGHLLESGTSPERGTTAKTLAEGAPPSNTAPSNYIDPPTEPLILRSGVDSLYLSYAGTLPESREKQLQNLKIAAQSEGDTLQSTAQLCIGDHLFEVMGRGKGRFPFVLKDHDFNIQLSANASKAMPLAYAQISSELLTHVPLATAVDDLSRIIGFCGPYIGGPQVSRLDLFVDFVSTVPMNSWSEEAWVTRAEGIIQYTHQQRFSGWAIGQGGDLSARLYDKTLELEKSKKDYLKPLWQAAGWDGESPVWRLEFQFRRTVLGQLGVLEMSGLIAHMDNLWSYACREWLRLTVPNSEDSNRARWPTHPLWEALARVPLGDGPNITLKRAYQDRMPSDQSLYVNGLGGITSFMAKNGITDPSDGFREFFAQAQKYHSHTTDDDPTGLEHYITRKVKAKGRKFSTLDNREPDQEQWEPDDGD